MVSIKNSDQKNPSGSSWSLRLLVSGIKILGQGHKDILSSFTINSYSSNIPAFLHRPRNNSSFPFIMPQNYSRELGFFDSRDDKKRNIACHVKLPFPNGEYRQTWYSFSRDKHELTGAQLSLKTKRWGYISDDATLERLIAVIRNAKLDYDEQTVSITSMIKLV